MQLTLTEDEADILYEVTKDAARSRDLHLVSLNKSSEEFTDDDRKVLSEVKLLQGIRNRLLGV